MAKIKVKYSMHKVVEIDTGDVNLLELLTGPEACNILWATLVDKVSTFGEDVEDSIIDYWEADE